MPIKNRIGRAVARSETTSEADAEGQHDMDFVELDSVSKGTKGNLSGKWFDGIGINRFDP